MISKLLSYFIDISYIYGLDVILDPTIPINKMKGLLEFYNSTLNFQTIMNMHVLKYIDDFMEKAAIQGNEQWIELKEPFTGKWKSLVWWLCKHI